MMDEALQMLRERFPLAEVQVTARHDLPAYTSVLVLRARSWDRHGTAYAIEQVVSRELMLCCRSRRYIIETAIEAMAQGAIDRG